MTRLETTKGKSRVIVEIDRDFSTIQLSGSNGMEKYLNTYTKDLVFKLEELLKLLAYVRGDKAHATIATRLMLEKVGA